MKLFKKLKSVYKKDSISKKVKFSIGNFDESNIEYDYGDVYETSEKSIKISANNHQIKLISKLVEHLNPPYYVLYVLVVSRTGKDLGRYQSPLFENREELISFLLEYKEYFETDGRHHIWVGTVDNSGLIVYDQHNVIFGYGPIKQFESTVRDVDYEEKRFEFPVPHCHSFHEENDSYEESIFNYFEWELFPLQSQDTYEE